MVLMHFSPWRWGIWLCGITCWWVYACFGNCAPHLRITPDTAKGGMRTLRVRSLALHQRKEKNNRAFWARLSFSLAQEEGYSSPTKIFRLDAYKRAWRALRLKCEPHSSRVRSESGFESLWLWQKIKDTHKECPYFLAQEEGFEPPCLLGKRFSRPPRCDRFDIPAYIWCGLPHHIYAVRFRSGSWNSFHESASHTPRRCVKQACKQQARGSSSEIILRCSKSSYQLFNVRYYFRCINVNWYA